MEISLQFHLSKGPSLVKFEHLFILFLIHLLTLCFNTTFEIKSSLVLVSGGGRIGPFAVDWSDEECRWRCILVVFFLFIGYYGSSWNFIHLNSFGFYYLFLWNNCVVPILTCLYVALFSLFGICSKGQTFRAFEAWNYISY